MCNGNISTRHCPKRGSAARIKRIEGLLANIDPEIENAIGDHVGNAIWVHDCLSVFRGDISRGGVVAKDAFVAIVQSSSSDLVYIPSTTGVWLGRGGVSPGYIVQGRR